MDRPIYWTTAQLRTLDLATGERGKMIALGKLIEGIFGTGAFVTGLSCGPTGPASMQVVVGPGQIFSLQNVDSSGFSVLASDTTHQIVKQGVLMDAVNLSCPAGGSAGQSINYLIQATFQEVDVNPVVLTYVNSANPASPWSGPNNTGATNYTLRQDLCAVTVKAGTAATTGTQTTPTPDSGSVGLYVVTVANGATSIVSGNIVQYASTSILPFNLFALANGFGSAQASSGFQKLPSGLILQWGSWTGNAVAGNPTAISFPVTFPNAVFATLVSAGGSTTSPIEAWYDSPSVSGFNGHASITSNLNSFWAIGR